MEEPMFLLQCYSDKDEKKTRDGLLDVPTRRSLMTWTISVQERRQKLDWSRKEGGEDVEGGGQPAQVQGSVQNTEGGSATGAGAV